jgi:hypothetical protein
VAKSTSGSISATCAVDLLEFVLPCDALAFQPTFDEMKAARDRMRPVSETEIQLEEYRQFDAKDIPQKLV